MSPTGHLVRNYSIKFRLGTNGATEQNLLKLFEKLVDGQISNIPTIVPSISESKERVIY